MSSHGFSLFSDVASSLFVTDVFPYHVTGTFTFVFLKRAFFVSTSSRTSSHVFLLISDSSSQTFLRLFSSRSFMSLACFLHVTGIFSSVTILKLAFSFLPFLGHLRACFSSSQTLLSSLSSRALLSLTCFLNLLLALSIPSQLKPAFSSLPSRTSSHVFLHFSDVACHFRPSTHSFSSVRLTRPIALKRPVPCYWSTSARPGWDPRLDFHHPRDASSRGFVPGAATPWQAPSPLHSGHRVTFPSRRRSPRQPDRPPRLALSGCRCRLHLPGVGG